MSITYENNEAIFTSVIYEDEVVPFRDYLKEKSGEILKFNFTECEDIHLAVMQLIFAYKKTYACEYEFGDVSKIFEKVLKGFSSSENHCN